MWGLFQVGGWGMGGLLAAGVGRAESRTLATLSPRMHLLAGMHAPHLRIHYSHAYGAFILNTVPVLILLFIIGFCSAQT